MNGRPPGSPRVGSGLDLRALRRPGAAKGTADPLFDRDQMDPFSNEATPDPFADLSGLDITFSNYTPPDPSVDSIPTSPFIPYFPDVPAPPPLTVPAPPPPTVPAPPISTLPLLQSRASDRCGLPFLPMDSNPLNLPPCPPSDAPFPSDIRTTRRKGSGVKQATDRRGRPPLIKRWRLYCFRRVFVIEPNIPRNGIRHNAERILPLSQMDRSTNDNDIGGRSNTPSSSSCSSPSSSSASLGLPQLIIFRNSDVIVEVPNATHQLYNSFGPLQQLFLIDSLIGQVHIADARFLAVVAESEAVAGISSHSLSSDRQQKGELDSFVYRIQRAWLIPFHLSLENISLRHSSMPNVPRGAAMGLYYDEMSLRKHRRPKQQHPTLRHQHSSGSATDFDLNSDRSPRRNSRDDLEARRSSDPFNQPQISNVSNDNVPSENVPSENVPNENVPNENIPNENGESTAQKTLPVTSVEWDWNGFGDAYFNSLLGEKLAGYKQGVEKLLASSFYYSYEFELTHTLQRKRHLGLSFEPQSWPCDFVEDTTYENLLELPSPPEHPKSISLMEVADQRFVWNSYLYYPFSAWSVDTRWFTPIMQGRSSFSLFVLPTSKILFCFIRF